MAAYKKTKKSVKKKMPLKNKRKKKWGSGKPPVK